MPRLDWCRWLVSLESCRANALTARVPSVGIGGVVVEEASASLASAWGLARSRPCGLGRWEPKERAETSVWEPRSKERGDGECTLQPGLGLEGSIGLVGLGLEPASAWRPSERSLGREPGGDAVRVGRVGSAQPSAWRGRREPSRGLLVRRRWPRAVASAHPREGGGVGLLGLARETQPVVACFGPRWRFDPAGGWPGSAGGPGRTTPGSAQEKKRYIGTRLASGQDILCQQLILDPSFKIPSLDMPSDASDSNSPRKVARGICITSSSIKPGKSSVLVVFPPKSLQEQQTAAVRVLQLSSNVAVCPPGMFMAYLSTPCTDASMGKQCINKAIEVLFSAQGSDDSEGDLETTSENIENAKPTLMWNCVYVQEITQGTSGTGLSCPMPDENLDYRNILESTKKLFADTYPNEEFLPRNSAPKYADEDSDSAE